MKRKMEITVDGVTLKVTVEGIASKKTLMKYELRYVVESVTEGIIPILAKAPHIRAHIQDVKVK